MPATARQKAVARVSVAHRRALHWRRLMRTGTYYMPFTPLLTNGHRTPCANIACFALGKLIAMGSLAGITAADLGPCFASADQRLRELELEALAMVGS